MKRTFPGILVYCLVFLTAVFVLSKSRPEQVLVTWHMINVNHTDKQGDAHLLTFYGQPNPQSPHQAPAHSQVLIDTGDQGDWIVPQLKRLGVQRLDTVLISHPHHDHYGGLTDIVRSGIQVGEVYLSVPDREICDKEIPWGCASEEIANLVEFLKTQNIPIRQAQAGEVLFPKPGTDSSMAQLGTHTELKVLFSYDGVNTPIGKTDINDMSTLVLLKAGTTKALFTGDLNIPLGKYLAEQALQSSDHLNLRADILKVPHHGTEGTAPNEFFDAVHPKIALIPSPLTLWKSDRSSRIRNYFEQEKGIETWVNGRDGTILVEFYEKGIKVGGNRRSLLGQLESANTLTP